MKPHFSIGLVSTLLLVVIGGGVAIASVRERAGPSVQFPGGRDDVAGSPLDALRSKIGQKIRIELRRDQLGIAASRVPPIHCLYGAGTELFVGGRLVDVQPGWLVVETSVFVRRDESVLLVREEPEQQWVPMDSVLLIGFATEK